MLILFFKERCSWILFFVTVLVCMNGIFYIDSGFSGISIIYINIILSLLFIFFIASQYIIEVRQLRVCLGNILDSSKLLSLESISISPYQRKMLDAVATTIDEKESLLNHSKIQLQEEKEDLLAWVHEMKTPLTAMKLMIEQIDNIKMQSKIENEWMRIHLLLDQQLHKTRLGTMEQDNRIERFPLRTILYKEIREFQSWCMEKGVGFDVDELSQEVATDKKWLAFIVRQILSNAIKYSHKNQEIRIYTEMDSDGHLLLHIQDNGIGINQEDLPRIFKKSYTGTVGRGSGHSTGMGLYLAQNASQKLGLQILVESKVNEGSRLTLRFPIQNEYQNILGR